MVDDGAVSHVLVWRLDRLSRSLGDLISLADRFGQADVSLHSFTEKLDCPRQQGGCSTTSSDRSLSSTESSSPKTSTRHAPSQPARTVDQSATHGLRPQDGDLIANDDADTVRDVSDFEPTASAKPKSQDGRAQAVHRLAILRTAPTSARSPTKATGPPASTRRSSAHERLGCCSSRLSHQGRQAWQGPDVGQGPLSVAGQEDEL